MKKIILLVSAIFCTSLLAQSPDLKNVKLGGFIDTYYAYDFNRPQDQERQYTTQAARHNEFNINMAFIDLTLKEEKNRGRLALQYGTSVSKNYSSDPINGNTTGPDKSRMLQEAFLGRKIADKTWLDAGIYFGHIGMENWISRDSWTYTRSLFLDYVPYYQTGLRLSHDYSEKLKFQLHLINGWQNISENNQDKALGGSVAWTIDQKNKVTYNNFLGNEKRSSGNPTIGTASPQATIIEPTRTRFYNNFIWEHVFNELWQMKLGMDLGVQKAFIGNGWKKWYSTNLTVRHKFSEKSYIAMRGEWYDDHSELNVATGTRYGFQTYGGSVNYDYHWDERALWRLEMRGLRSKDEIFPKAFGLARTNIFIVGSMALSF